MKAERKTLFRRTLIFLLMVLVGIFAVTGCKKHGNNNSENATLDIITHNYSETENQTEKETKKPEAQTEKSEKETKKSEDEAEIDENGTYTSKDDVALYIHTFGKLPSNFITKKEAKKLGWSGGSLKEYAPGKCIGGDRFGNYERSLPEKKGRKYTECDIDTLNKKSRGAKRIIFSNDGLIYYTDDHYKTFTKLY